MLGLVLCASLVVPGQASPSKDDVAAQVRQLVRQLDSAQLGQREQAEQSLVKLGPAALAHLPDVTERTPADVAQRLARVRTTLERQQAIEAGKPSLVTLKADAMPVAEALDAISKQTGNKIVFDRRQFDDEVAQAKIAVAFDKTPFWEVLDLVLDQAGLTVDEFSGEGGLTIGSRREGMLRRSEARSIQGALRIHALRFEASRDLTRKDDGTLRLALSVAWEPRLRLVAIDYPLESINAGDNAKVQGADNAEAQLSAAINQGATSVEIQIPFQSPPRSVEKIAKLKGRLNVMLLGPVETFRFDKLPIAQGAQAPAKVELSKGGAVVAIDGVRKNNDLWEVRTRVRFDNKSKSFESHLNWVTENEAYLVGADKKRIPYGGIESTATGETEFGVAYLFLDLPKGPAGMSFVYKTATSVLELPVDFELTDLPLP